MPDGQRPSAATTWVIRSVAVRTRDGPERLDQVYRRLINDDLPMQRHAAADPQAGRAIRASADEPPR